MRVSLAFSYLDVIVRIPVAIVDDHRVRRGEIDAQAPCPGGEKKAELFSTRSVETIDGILSIGTRRFPVHSFVLVPVIFQEIFQYVEHAGHLREDQNSMPLLL